MVHALRLAHRIVAPSGVVIDLHPSAAPATVRLGDSTTGTIDSPDAPLRHAAAGAALAAVVDDGFFAVERALVFTFNTYSDTIEELRDFLAAHWRDGRINDRTVEETRAKAMREPGSRPHVAERVHVTRLRPLTRLA